MSIPVKKTLNNASYIDTKLLDFSEICLKKSSEIGCVLLIVSWRSFPPKFPAKSADFSANLPLKFPRNFAFFSAKYQKPWIENHGDDDDIILLMMMMMMMMMMIKTSGPGCSKLG